MEVVWLLAGLLLLFFSGNWLVKSSVELAKHFKVSTMVIGITVVAFGTSAPELFVSLNAVFDGSPDISVGNVVGSNIANIALVLGLVAMVFPITVKKSSIVNDWLVMIGGCVVFYCFAFDGILVFWEGGILFFLLISFLVYTVRKSRKSEKSVEVPKMEMKLHWALLLLLISIVGLYYGSEWMVIGAKVIALKLGVSERIIGISIVAFGTSVPELATSLIAAFKKETDISIGNIIGSNIFNILCILGVTSMVKNINISSEILHVDFWWMFSISIILMLLLLPLKKGLLSREKGLLLVALYVTYIVVLFG